MSPEDVKKLFSGPGLYLLEDGRCPGATSAVVTMTDTHEVTGEMIHRAFCLYPRFELSEDIRSWDENHTTRLVGGPFSVPTCHKLAQERLEHDDLLDRVEESRHLLCMLRDACLKGGSQVVAEAAQIILDVLSGKEPHDNPPNQPCT